MPLGTDYASSGCSLARTLEVVGERWTLLIVRDLLFGVRRFSAIQRHLDIPKAVLAERLRTLETAQVIERGGHEITLTPAGEELWPAVHTLMQWGERHMAPDGPVRLFSHARCATELDPTGACPTCNTDPHPREIEMRPGPGAKRTRDDAVTVALREPHLLLAPLS
jgi:DNA-binding HxlR family transcriptional regulator